MKTLYLSDLDGTLLTPGRLSPFTAETLRRLLGSGMAFSYATARSFSTAKKVTAALKGARLPVIVYNGAAIVEAESGAVLDAVYFTPAETAFIRGVLEAAGLRPMVYSRAKAHVRAERVAYVEAGARAASRSTSKRAAATSAACRRAKGALRRARLLFHGHRGQPRGLRGAVCGAVRRRAVHRPFAARRVQRRLLFRDHAERREQKRRPQSG